MQNDPELLSSILKLKSIEMQVQKHSITQNRKLLDIVEIGATVQLMFDHLLNLWDSI